MKKLIHLSGIFLVIAVVFSSCELVGDIFEAGAWFGIIGVILVVALILWLIGKLRD